MTEEIPVEILDEAARRCGFPDWKTVSGVRSPEFTEAIRELAKALVERGALQAFKDYVHQRLDEAGIPADPKPTGSALPVAQQDDLAKMTVERDQWRANFQADQAENERLNHRVRDLRVRLEEAERILAYADAIMRNCEVSSEYCCCGSPVKDHGMGDGHSPVDEGAHAADQWAKVYAAFTVQKD